MASSVGYYAQQQTKLMTIKPLYLGRYCSPTFVYLVARGSFSSDNIVEAFVISFLKMLAKCCSSHHKYLLFMQLATLILIIFVTLPQQKFKIQFFVYTMC